MTTNDADVLALAEELDRLAKLATAEITTEECLRNWQYQAPQVAMKLTRALSRPVPEGFVLVPKEADIPMMEAFDPDGNFTLLNFRRRYRAMIDAAPSEREDR